MGLGKSTPMGAILGQLEQTKARIPAKVEHPYRVIKRQSGYVKVKCRGLANREHGQPDDAVCALQSLDGSAQSFAAAAEMSAPETSQRDSGKGEMPLFANPKAPDSSSCGLFHLSGYFNGRFEHLP